MQDGISRALTAALCATLLGAGCAAPRLVHEPHSYPDEKVATGAIDLEIVDMRQGRSALVAAPEQIYPGERQSYSVLVPESVERTAAARLRGIASGHGPALRVRMSVREASTTFTSDHRGEWTRVDVRLEFEVFGQDGSVIQRGSGNSYAELPSADASEQEIRQILEATCLNAFDEYWASADTVERLSRNWSAYRKSRSL